MNRSCQLAALAALVTAIAGCSLGTGGLAGVPSASPTAPPSLTRSSPDPSPSDTAPPTTAPTASPYATPSPTEPAVDPATVFAASGIGPYVVGSRLSKLKSQALVANVEPSFHCDAQWQNAEATGRYADKLTVSFFLGSLIDVHANSSEFVTLSSARVGMLLTELQRIYGKRGTLVTGVSGNQAFSVRVPDTTLGIVFFLDEANAKVGSMSAGEVEPLEAAAVNGEGC
jgi:hypothetical protein